ncbi:hypothetical protein Dimus_022851 [Dionaea muscipula]
MGRRRGGKRNVKEAATKTESGMARKRSITKGSRQNRAQLASQSEGQRSPKQQQKLPMATGEEKRLKGAVAVMQSGHGEGSASMIAQVVKGKGTDKSGAKEVEKRWSCPNVEPMESILHTNVA